MRKITNYLLSLLAIAGVMVFTSCDPEEETPATTPPSLTLSIVDPQDSYEVGDIVKIKADFTAEAKLIAGTISLSADNQDFTITITNGGIAANVIDLNFFSVANNTEGSFTINLPIESDFEGKDIEIEIEIEDGEGRNASDDISFKVVESLKIFETVLLFAPDSERQQKTFFSLSEGVTFTANEVVNGPAGTSAKIDLGYYYGTNDNASLAAPASYPSLIYNLGPNGQNWGTRNATKLKSTAITATQFIEIVTREQLRKAFDDGTTEAGVKTKLVVGDVIAFETASTSEFGGGKRGLIRVKAITAGAGTTGQIDLEIIVED